MTAAGVLGAIDNEKYDVIPIGVTKTGQWVLASGDPTSWLLSSGQTAPHQVPRELSEVDVVFPVLHRPFGEDGTIQGLLALFQPSTSSGPTIQKPVS